MEYRTNLPWKAKIAALLKGEWQKIGLLDLVQFSLGIGGIAAGLFFMSPELAALLEIRDRLDPAVKLEDRMFIKQVQVNGERMEVEVGKLVTSQDVSYQVWMCGGTGLKTMSFIGSGVLGPQESTVVLSSVAANDVTVALLQLETESFRFTKAERWDVRRAVRESPTVRMDGIVTCDEVDADAV